MAQDPMCGMKVDEKSGIVLRREGKAYYFCSSHCMRKFMQQERIPAQEAACCAPEARQAWHKNRTVIVAFVLLALIIASFFVSPLVGFRESFLSYLKTIWWAVALGLVLGGVIDYFVPREYVSLVLAQPKRITIVYAVLMGFLMSACSHGILALSIQLHKKGASTAAVVAFLIASPWANMALTIMLVAFFGLKGFFIIFAAIIIALVSGFIFQFLEEKNLVERNRNSAAVDANFSIRADIARRMREHRFSRAGLLQSIKGIAAGACALADMVVWWILIGMAIASFAGAYIPSHIFHSYMGPTLAGLLVTLLFATIIEVCSEGSAPMAFELFKQTGAFGNSFVFLMAGVATDYTEIGLLWHNVGKKTALWLPIVVVPQVVLVGFLANIIFK